MFHFLKKSECSGKVEHTLQFTTSGGIMMILPQPVTHKTHSSQAHFKISVKTDHQEDRQQNPSMHGLERLKFGRTHQ